MKDKNRPDTKEGLLLFFSTEEAEFWFEEFLYGVEEEGLPLYLMNSRKENIAEQDSVSLANMAAYYCCFDLGIGVDKDKLVIRHRLQKDKDPLLELDRKSASRKKIRRMGHNAARIIKSDPLML